MKLSKDVLQKIKHIEIQTRRLLSGSLIGDYSSTQKGSGMEFDQIREYQQGDDIRFIDWNATARSGKILVKQYIDERNRNVMLLVDNSGSTMFGSTEHLKSETIAQVASVLALVADCGKDHVGALLFPEEVTKMFAPKMQPRNVGDPQERTQTSRKQTCTTTVSLLHCLSKTNSSTEQATPID